MYFHFVMAIKGKLHCCEVHNETYMLHNTMYDVADAIPAIIIIWVNHVTFEAVLMAHTLSSNLSSSYKATFGLTRYLVFVTDVVTRHTDKQQ